MHLFMNIELYKHLNFKFQILYENTYQLEPTVKFKPDEVAGIIEHTLKKYLEGFCYIDFVQLENDICLISLLTTWHSTNSIKPRNRSFLKRSPKT